MCRVACHEYYQNTNGTFDSHRADFFADLRDERSKGTQSLSADTGETNATEETKYTLLPQRFQDDFSLGSS